jgi:hypothetical protein
MVSSNKQAIASPPISPAAERMRRSRQRRRDGLRSLTIELRGTEIDKLIRLGFLDGGSRNDATAVLRALYRVFDRIFAWHCGRRVAIIYSSGDVFACRQCCGLAYASQQEPVRERGISTARKIRMRLGGAPNITRPFPDKPKGMHWRTYDRLRRVHDQAYARLQKGQAKSVERLERWMKTGSSG